MHKDAFLQLLRKRLSGLSRQEREERLSFYREMIEDRMEEGLSEEAAVAAVGSADEIAGQIVYEYAPKKKNNGGKLALILAGSPLWFPLLLAVLAVALAVLIALWAVVIALWAAFVGIAGSAVGGILGGGIYMVVIDVPGGLLLLSCGMICIGLAIFAFFGCKAVSKAMVWLTQKTVKWCKACFGKKEVAR